MRIKVWKLSSHHAMYVRLHHANVLHMEQGGPRVRAEVPLDKDTVLHIPELLVFDDPLTNPKLHRADVSFPTQGWRDDPMTPYLIDPAGWLKDRLNHDLSMWFPDAELVHVLLRQLPVVSPIQVLPQEGDKRGLMVEAILGAITVLGEGVEVCPEDGKNGWEPWEVLTEDLSQEMYVPPLPRLVTP